MRKLGRRTTAEALGMSLPLGGLVSPTVLAQDDGELENGRGDETGDNGIPVDDDGDEPDYGD